MTAVEGAVELTAVEGAVELTVSIPASGNCTAKSFSVVVMMASVKDDDRVISVASVGWMPTPRTRCPSHLSSLFGLNASPKPVEELVEEPGQEVEALVGPLEELVEEPGQEVEELVEEPGQELVEELVGPLEELVEEPGQEVEEPVEELVEEPGQEVEEPVEELVEEPGQEVEELVGSLVQELVEALVGPLVDFGSGRFSGGFVADDLKESIMNSLPSDSDDRNC